MLNAKNEKEVKEIINQRAFFLNLKIFKYLVEDSNLRSRVKVHRLTTCYTINFYGISKMELNQRF